MNAIQEPVQPRSAVFTEDGFNLVGAVRVLAGRKRLVFGLPVAAAVLSAALSLALPDVYRATTKLLPPQQSQSSGAAALLSQLGGMAGAAAGVAGLKNPNDLYVGMLKSRTVADNMVRRFNLIKAYDTDSLEKARKTLEGNTFVASGKDGLITIDVEDQDKKRVAPLANAYVEELIALTKSLALTEASQRRLFFSQQLELTKNNLANVEAELKSGLEARGVISVDVESRAILETVGRLRAQISAKEIQLSSMRAFVTSNNPEFIRAQEELGSARAELAKLENGRGTQDGQGKGQGLENIKLLREVKYQQALYEMLVKQFEIARLDEARTAAIIQVLDAAVEPERKAKPKRSVIVLLATLLAFAATVAWVFFAESRQKTGVPTTGKAA